MTLDGWSLDQKISKLRDALTTEMRELRLQFAVLYDYMKKMEESKKSSSKGKKASTLKD